MNRKGITFENAFLGALEGCKEYRHSSSVQDKTMGTDFYWLRLPIDITLQPLRSKTCCYFLKRYDSIYGPIDVGVRIGNIRRIDGKYKECYFKDNVMVISFNNTLSLSWVRMHTLVYDLMKEVDLECTDAFWELSDKLDSIVKQR